MSTRLRVLLKVPNGETIRDKYAVLQLCVLTKNLGYKRALKDISGSKRARLQLLATALPIGYSLILVQEPKRTRKNKSYCWDKLPLKAPAVKVPLLPQPAYGQVYFNADAQAQAMGFRQVPLVRRRVRQ